MTRGGDGGGLLRGCIIMMQRPVQRGGMESNGMYMCLVCMGDGGDRFERRRL